MPLSAEYPLLEYEHVSDTCLGVDSGNVTPVEGSVDSENVTPVEGSIEGVRCWELQTADSGMPEVEVGTVKGRLGKCIPFWKEELCDPPG